MKKIFENIFSTDINKEPFNYIHKKNFVELNEYDKLYENMHYLNAIIWSQWRKTHELYNEKLLFDVQDFNPDYKCVALWFFTDRGERKLTSKKDIEIYSTTKNASRIITREPNSFLFFELNDEQRIRISPPEETRVLRPCIQFDFSVDVFRELLNKYA